MRYAHPDHPGRAVRLGYCLNVLAGEDLSSLERALEEVCAPVRAEVAPRGLLGVGLYLPASLALPLSEDGAADERRRLAARLAGLGLCAFTANAFPYGGFHRPGLKGGVFRPAWDERDRWLYTMAVAGVAAELAPPDASHVAVSTHTGLLRADDPGLERVEAVGRGIGFCLRGLSVLEQRTGRRVVLALEPEPRSLAGDTRELVGLWPRLVAGIEAELVERGEGDPRAAVERHLGLCLDTCHAAVEFEDGAEAAARVRGLGLPLGKVQVSSALRLPDPDRDAAGRARLFALDEPVYLHQVTGRRGGELVRAQDLAELREDGALAGCEEWRCHFHVPVDAPDPLPDAGGLSTTADDARRTLAALLSDPARWGTRELHLEVETYTFDVLPSDWRAGGLASGLARELAWTARQVEARGWRPAPSAESGDHDHRELSPARR